MERKRFDADLTVTNIDCIKTSVTTAKCILDGNTPIQGDVQLKADVTCQNSRGRRLHHRSGAFPVVPHQHRPERLLRGPFLFLARLCRRQLRHAAAEQMTDAASGYEQDLACPFRRDESVQRPTEDRAYEDVEPIPATHPCRGFAQVLDPALQRAAVGVMRLDE